MAVEKKNITYTAADFHRYYAGTMNDAERHALEKAALEDPFLADALDGYSYTGKAEQDIASLKERISERVKRKKTSLISFNGNNLWWRVAAILIIGAGVLYLARTVNEPKEIPIAQTNSLNKKHDSGKITTPPVPGNSVMNESNSTSERVKPAQAHAPATDTLLAVNSIPESEKETKKSLRRDAAVDELVLRDRTPLEYSTLEADTDAAKEVKDSARKEVPKAIPGKKTLKKSESVNLDDKRYKYNFTGKIIDNNGNPVQGAIITEKNVNSSVASDAYGKFLIAGNDSIAIASINAIGYNNIDRKLNSNTEQTIVLTPANTELSAVVVTGINRKSRKKEDSNLQAKVSGVEIQTAQPVNGPDSFKSYVNDNVRRQSFNDSTIRNGEVILSFKVKKNGDPYKIRIEKSLCPACDEEAIRLLREGPKWKYVNNKRVTHVFYF